MVLDVKRIYRSIMEDPDIVADNDTSKEEIAMDLATQRVVQHERNIQANNLGSTVSKLLQFLEKADDDDEDERYQDLTHHVDDAHEKISNYKNRNVRGSRKILENLEAKNIEIGNASDALEEYENMERADYEDAEEYRDEREGAWENFLDELDATDASEVDTRTAEEAERAETTPTETASKESLSSEDIKGLSHEDLGWRIQQAGMVIPDGDATEYVKNNRAEAEAAFGNLSSGESAADRLAAFTRPYKTGQSARSSSSDPSEEDIAELEETGVPESGSQLNEGTVEQRAQELIAAGNIAEDDSVGRTRATAQAIKELEAEESGDDTSSDADDTEADDDTDHIFHHSKYSDDDKDHINHIREVDAAHDNKWSKAFQDLKDKVDKDPEANPKVGSPPTAVIRTTGPRKGGINIPRARMWLRQQGGDLAHDADKLSLPATAGQATESSSRRSSRDEPWADKVSELLMEHGGEGWKYSGSGEEGVTREGHDIAEFDRKVRKILRDNLNPDASPEETARHEEDLTNKAIEEEAKRLGVDISSAGERPKIENIKTTPANATAQRIVRDNKPKSNAVPDQKQAGQAIEDERTKTAQTIATDDTKTDDEKHDEIDDVNAGLQGALEALGHHVSTQVNTDESSDDAIAEHTGSYKPDPSDPRPNPFGGSFASATGKLAQQQARERIAAHTKREAGFRFQRLMHTDNKDKNAIVQEMLEAGGQEEVHEALRSLHRSEGPAHASWHKGIDTALKDESSTEVAEEVDNYPMPRGSDKGTLNQTGDSTTIMGKDATVEHAATNAAGDGHYELHRHEDGSGTIRSVNAETGKQAIINHYPEEAGGFERALEEHNKTLLSDDLEEHTPTPTEGEAKSTLHQTGDKGKMRGDDTTVVHAATSTDENPVHHELHRHEDGSGSVVSKDAKTGQVLDEMSSLYPKYDDAVEGYTARLNKDKIKASPDMQRTWRMGPLPKPAKEEEAPPTEGEETQGQLPLPESDEDDPQPESAEEAPQPEQAEEQHVRHKTGDASKASTLVSSSLPRGADGKVRHAATSEDGTFHHELHEHADGSGTVRTVYDAVDSSGNVPEPISNHYSLNEGGFDAALEEHNQNLKDDNLDEHDSDAPVPEAASDAPVPEAASEGPVPEAASEGPPEGPPEDSAEDTSDEEEPEGGKYVKPGESEQRMQRQQESAQRSPATYSGGTKDKEGQYRFSGGAAAEGGMPSRGKGRGGTYRQMPTREQARAEEEGTRIDSPTPREEPEVEEEAPYDARRPKKPSEIPAGQQTLEDAAQRQKAGVTTKRGVDEQEEANEAKSALLDTADRTGVFEYLADTRPFSHTSPQKAREKLAALDMEKLETTLDGHHEKARTHMLAKQPHEEPIREDRNELLNRLAKVKGTTNDEAFADDHKHDTNDELKASHKTLRNANEAAVKTATKAEEKKIQTDNEAATKAQAKAMATSMTELPEGTGPIQAQQRMREVFNIMHKHNHVFSPQERVRLTELMHDAVANGADVEVGMREAEEQAEQGGYSDTWIKENADRAKQNQAEHDEYDKHINSRANTLDRAEAFQRSGAETLIQTDDKGEITGSTHTRSGEAAPMKRTAETALEHHGGHSREDNKPHLFGRNVPSKILGQTPEQQEAQQQHHDLRNSEEHTNSDHPDHEETVNAVKTLEDDNPHLQGMGKSETELEEERKKAGRPPGPPPRAGLEWSPNTSRWVNPDTLRGIQSGLKDGELAVMPNGLHGGTDDAHLDDPNNLSTHTAGGHRGNMNTDGSYNPGTVVVSKNGMHAATVPNGPATAKNVGPLGHIKTASHAMGAAVKAHMGANLKNYSKKNGDMEDKVVVKGASDSGSHFANTGIFQSSTHAPPAKQQGRMAKIGSQLNIFRSRQLNKSFYISKALQPKKKATSKDILFRSGHLSYDSKQAIRDHLRNAQMIREIEEIAAR